MIALDLVLSSQGVPPWASSADVEEHLFVLPQALALVDFYTAQLSACDAQIERAFSVIKPRFAPVPEVSIPAAITPPPRRKPHSHSKNAPAVNTRVHILRIIGVDLVAVH